MNIFCNILCSVAEESVSENASSSTPRAKKRRLADVQNVEVVPNTQTPLSEHEAIDIAIEAKCVGKCKYIKKHSYSITDILYLMSCV